jgi:starch phosphorylase
MPKSLEPFVARTRTAYFSMEMAIRPEMHTYAGGLGILAGDTARSCADLNLPLVFVTLISRAGYFRQLIDENGRQREEPDWWEPGRWCTPVNAMVALEIEGRLVWIRPWLHVLKCPHGSQMPILLLDTDLDQNAAEDRTLTHSLYGGDDSYRLKQEIILGIGGFRLLRAIGFEIERYHLNEGHAALLTLAILEHYRRPSEGHPANGNETRDDAVRERCIFTTHTPVDAGHDRFSYDLFERLMPELVPPAELRRLAGPECLNMTRLALNLAGYINGVARRHAETTARMFPGFRVRAINNGIHPATWAHDAFAELFDDVISHWRHEPGLLVRALNLADADIRRCHQRAKRDLIEHVRIVSGVKLDPGVMIIGFARRMTSYKRPLLLFENLDRLRAIARNMPFQLVIAGKAHPKDEAGKEAIRQIHAISRELRDDIRCVFLPDYEMQLAKVMVSGSDVWLNTPLPPLEASGTSGMKAAINGVLNLSALDGWWVEACIEGVTGWAIGADDASGKFHSIALLDKLETAVLPLYYNDPDAWCRMMKHGIAVIASYFNSQNMMRRYASEAYLA